jgi:hypothetical protein
MGQPTFKCQVPDVVREQGVCNLALGKRYFRSEYIGTKERTRGTETSKYPEERTSTETPQVVASERGSGQWPCEDNRNDLERSALAGDSPVRVMRRMVLE